MRRTVQGQSLVEYLIVLPSLLLIVLGIIQFSLIYQARNLLNHATFVGARQGALSNGKIESIKDGVASAMTPLFMRVSLPAGSTLPDLIKARLIATIEVFNPNTARIEILSPTVEAFNEHNADGRIPNDNLMFRPTTADSGVSIQDANLLKIRVNYCFKLVVPFVNQLIYGLTVGLEGVKNLAGLSFDPTDTRERNINACSDINKMKAQATDYIVNEITSRAGPLAPLTGSLSSGAASRVTNSFGSLPLLNWNLGGVRIPIAAEAVVRMQTPYAM